MRSVHMQTYFFIDVFGTFVRSEPTKILMIPNDR